MIIIVRKESVYKHINQQMCKCKNVIYRSIEMSPAKQMYVSHKETRRSLFIVTKRGPTILMRILYSSVLHGFIMQLSDRQCQLTQNIPHPVEMIDLKIITNRQTKVSNQQPAKQRMCLTHTSVFTKKMPLFDPVQ